MKNRKSNNIFSNPGTLRLIVVLLPLLLYLNTLQNEYALDDSIVITQNIFVQKGIHGLKEIFSADTFTGFFRQKKDLVEGSRYRPLSVATFAVEYQLWGLKPGLSHLINVIIYSVLCLLLFNTLLYLLNYFGMDKNSVQIAFFASLIFIVHPVHTEVVANIKGRDELFSVLFFLITLNLFLKYTENLKISYLLFSGISVFAGLLSKENTLFIWPVLAILILLNLRKYPLKRYLPFLAMLAAGTLTYMLIRISAVGEISAPGSKELMNNPFLHASAGQKYATILYTLLLYLKLLFIPHPLTYDYYPYHIALHDWSDIGVILSLFIYMGIIILSIRISRKHSLISFGILFYIITLLPLTNLLINIGSFMNERFLFLPGIGFSIVFGTIVASIIFQYKRESYQSKLSIALFSIVLLLFALMTISRNTQWKNNLTLFTHDVRISSGSAKGNCAAGGVLYETALTLKDKAEKMKMLEESIGYLQKSVKIYPGYIDALLLLGNASFEYNHDFQTVNTCYHRIFQLAPGYKLAISNYSNILSGCTDPLLRKNGFKKIIQLEPDNFEANYQLGITYGKMMGQMDTATMFLQNAVRINPENGGANRDLGVAYAMSGNYEASLPFFEKVIQLDPENPDNYINLGITFQNIGQSRKASEMFSKAEELRKK
jgi:protein O-mannosyl-transferase